MIEFVEFICLLIYNIIVTNKDKSFKIKGVKIMNLAKNRSQSGELLTLQQACELSNLGSTTVRRLASEAGAVRKIGKSYRIKREPFFLYIDSAYAE